MDAQAIKTSIRSREYNKGLPQRERDLISVQYTIVNLFHWYQSEFYNCKTGIFQATHHRTSKVQGKAFAVIAFQIRLLCNSVFTGHQSWDERNCKLFSSNTLPIARQMSDVTKGEVTIFQPVNVFKYITMKVWKKWPFQLHLFWQVPDFGVLHFVFILQ